MTQDLTTQLGHPCLRLNTSAEPSQSYIGGVPRTAATFEWPVKEDRALYFIAQLDLAEINNTQRVSWLPTRGRLLFFYDSEGFPWGFDPADRGGWQVIYDNSTGALNPVQPPASLKPAYGIAGTQYLSATDFTSLPDTQRVDFFALDVSDEVADHYCEQVDQLYGDSPRHQVGGYPYPVQNDTMEDECQLVSGGVYCGNPQGYESEEAEVLRQETNDWRLLFQIDSDDDIDLMWGDSGLLYFWIRERDAQRQDFSKVWTIMQCC